MNETKTLKLWNKNFILLWQGTLFSTFGDVLYSICIGYWVYEKTGSTALMGLLSSISMFVAMFLGPFCGAIIDRSYRKWMIVGTDLIRGLTMIGLGLIAMSQHLEVWMVLVTALIAALCNAFFTPASMTVMTDLVMPKDLVRAQSLAGGMRSLVAMIGKGLSGAIIAFLGVPFVILLNGISLLISALTECFIDVPRAPKTGLPISLKILLADLKEGARYVLNDRCFRIIVVIAVTANFFGSGMNAVFLPFCLGKGLDVVQYGYLMSLQSISALIGTIVIGTLNIKSELRIKMMLFGFPLSSLLFAVCYSMQTFNTLALSFLITFFVSAVANAILNAAFMLVIPREKRAMISGFIMMASSGGQALSSLVFGLVAEFVDLSLLGTVSSLISILPFALMFIYPEVQKRFLQAELSPEL
ncbi:MFS transporter [Holdemania massiliensis]|uniref:MFS transporter n=1 Tax=Holdemania massiliensis TaxID=1468449 RepID=UPI003564A806